jgi:hypothetical protein
MLETKPMKIEMLQFWKAWNAWVEQPLHPLIRGAADHDIRGDIHKFVKGLFDPNDSYSVPFAERALTGQATWAELFEIIHEDDDPRTLFAVASVARELLKSSLSASEMDKLHLKPGPSQRGHVHVSFGDLHVRSHIMNQGCLVVLGSLTVDGFYNSSEEPISQAVVLDSMSAMGIDNDSWLFVGQDLNVSGAARGTYNDRSTNVGGTLRTPILMRDNHYFVTGRTETRLNFDIARELSDEARANLLSLVVDAVTMEDENEYDPDNDGPPLMTLDPDAVLDQVADKKEIFRNNVNKS